MSEVSLFAAAASALGLIGIVISVFLAFFQVEPSEGIHLTGKEMAFMLVSLSLLVIGIMLWLAVSNASSENPGGPDGGDPIVDSQGPGSQERQDGETAPQQDNDDEDKDLSPEELLVKQNWDEIQRLKAQYSEADTKVFQNEYESMEFHISEKAVLVFQDPANAEVCDILSGKGVSNVKLVILDYSTDQILFTLYSGDESYCRYSPGNEKIFYAVLFHDDYHIYVTRPFKVIRGNIPPYGTSIYLEKKEAQYTPMFQLRLHVKDLHTDEEYPVVPSQYNAAISVVKNDGTEYDWRCGRTTESGILTWMEGTYFSLNTDYKLDLYLQQTSEAGSIESTHQTFNGSITNSNQIDLSFEFNQEDSGT